jgi:hypothetical protein
MQPGQLGMNAVDQSSPLHQQVLAAVQERSQVRGRTDRQTHRRQISHPSGDPGDRQRVDRIGLPPAHLTPSLPRRISVGTSTTAPPMPMPMPMPN